MRHVRTAGPDPASVQHRPDLAAELRTAHVETVALEEPVFVAHVRLQPIPDIRILTQRRGQRYPAAPIITVPADQRLHIDGSASRIPPTWIDCLVWHPPDP